MLEDLHRGGQRTPFLPAEIGAARSGGQDELVIAVVLAVEHHLAGLGIDIDHLSQQDLNIGRIAHHLTQGGGDIGLRHQSRSHLIQQRLEEVEVAFIDQGDAHWLTRETMADLQARETTPNHHNVGPVQHRLIGRIELEKKAFHRLAIPSRDTKSMGISIVWGDDSDCSSRGLHTKNREQSQLTRGKNSRKLTI